MSGPEFVSERLDETHELQGFDSGVASLDQWLRRSARDSDGRNLTRTFVWHRGDGRVVAYFTVMPYLIERATLSKKQGRGLPDSISCFLIARLALHRDLHGQRLGSQLLASALTRLSASAADAGGRFVVVDAIDESASAFYQHHGFMPIPGVEQRLILPTKVLPTGDSSAARPAPNA